MLHHLRLVTIVALLVLTPQPSFAGRGDCGQPATDGDDVLSSDALAVLRASVQIERCGLCVCDVDGNGTVLSSDALTVLRASVGIPGANLTCDLCDGAGVSGTVRGLNGSLDDAMGARGDDIGMPFTGFTPVAGALVELHRIDDAGTSTALLDLEETDEAGNFSFNASPGLGRNLELRAFDSEGSRALSALATKPLTDIDPPSEFVLSTVLGVVHARGGGLALQNFTPSEYNGCVDTARAVRPENAPADSRAFVRLIGEVTGGLLAQQILSFAQSPDLSAVLDGSYWAFSAGLVVDARLRPGTIDVTPDENERCVGIDSGVGTIFFDGSGGFDFAGSEFTGYALCETSGTQRFSGGDDVKINATVTLEEETEDGGVEPGGTYDVAGDGSVLAVDPEGFPLPSITAPDGSLLGVTIFGNDFDEFDRGFAVLFPKATSGSKALLDGSFHLIDTEDFMFVEETANFIGRSLGFYSAGGSATANGNGDIDILFGAGTDIFLNKTAPPPANPPGDPNVTLDTEDFSAEPIESFTYDITADGAFELKDGMDLVASGAVSPDGNLLMFRSAEFDSGDASIISEYLVKKGSGLSRAGIAGDFLIVGRQEILEAEFTEGSFDGPPDSNFRGVCTATIFGSAKLESNGDFTLPGFVTNEVCLDEVSFVENSTANPAGRVFDAQVSLNLLTENTANIAGTWTVTGDGELSFTAGPIELKGAVAPDGSFLFLHTTGLEFGEVGAATRLVLMGIRQD